MPGETDLPTLLASMRPARRGEYAFCLLDEATFRALPVPPLGLFREAEGLTAILPREAAEAAGLAFTYTGVLITLEVHSSLHAVGFLARITTALAAAGVAVNVVSAIHHDHLFVAPADADRALAALDVLGRRGD
jgi:hypothetical protein